MKNIKSLVWFFLFCFSSNINSDEKMNIIFQEQFRRISYCKNFHIQLNQLIPSGAKILELGSSAKTNTLAKKYTMFSIEHNPNLIGKYNTTYIHATLKKYENYSWYDTELIQEELPAEYDLILINGPLKNISNNGFLFNINLFNTNVPIVIDNVHFKSRLTLLKNISNTLGRSYTVNKCRGPIRCCRRKYGVIL